MNGRYRIILFFIFLSLFLIIAKLFYWQVVKADELSYLGRTQYGTYLKIPAKRGDIMTSDSFPIVTNRVSYLLYANPKVVSDKEEAAQSLGAILKEDPATISALLSLDKFWVPIKDGIDDDLKTQVDKLHVPGIGYQDESARFYPEASLAAHLLGFVGKDASGDDKGYFGLEGEYDLQLRGKDGVVAQIHDALGKPIVSKSNLDSDATDGRSLVTSIDRAVQFMVEQKLSDGIEKYGAASGMVGIMDPKTGNIIAMASLPSFDPRSFKDYSQDLYKNPFITDLYEPGSTFKSLVMAAAIDENLVKPDTQCPICAGPVSIGGYDIHTWDDKYFPNTTMNEVIQHSDNTGMVYVAEKLGLDRMISSLNKFGIGQPTGIDLQGEVAPGIKPKEDWYPIDLATAGFGQGISVTPIELLDAFASLANDGKRMEPHVVTKIITSQGETIQINPKVLDQTVSPTTAKVMGQILLNAVENGEAQWTKLPGYKIAGKTGTAQIPIAGHYDPTKTIASFIGYGPVDNPRFVMLVIIDRPTSSIYGAETAAPIFFDIAKDLFTYYKIPPEQ